MTSEDIIKFYQYFYSKVYHYENFEYKPDSKNLKLISNFIFKLNNPSLGDNWLFDYFAFQFEYWSNIEYKKIKTVVLSFIIGKKALERYNNRPENWKYFTDIFIGRFGLNIKDICGDSFHKKDFYEISVSEELDKKRFIGEDRLYHCLSHTTLYNIRSRECVLCPFSKQCIEILKKKYPSIYKIRNEKKIPEESYSR